MTSYKNESIQTKAIKLSRLSHLEMICLLLNSLTECNFHFEVKVLERTLSAPLGYWSDKRTSKMASTLAKSLDWDGAAVARVIVNASKNQDIANALRSVGLYGGKLASARQHHEEMMAKFRMPRLDRDRYTQLKGMEGPFQFKGGEILYYDPREGKYYDRDADMYLSDLDADRITSRTARHKLAGTSGTNAVQALLPGTSDREASHFLHALAGEIIGGDILRRKQEKIRGELEVETSSGLHPSSPSYPDNDSVDGTTGMKSTLRIVVDMDDLERQAKINVSDLNMDNTRAVQALCDALTKNINGNILRNMDEDQLDLALGEVRHEVEYDIPEYHNLTHIEVLEYEYEVKDLEIQGGSLIATVLTEVEYGIFVEFDKDAWEADLY